MIVRSASSRCWQWQIGGCVAIVGILLIPAKSLAQIVPDNTLGAESSVVTPNLTIRGIQSDRIDGGAIRGTNLFHSFSQFNIDSGRGAYFANPAGIENILSRVTGTNRSNILGRLGVLDTANLFLINPNGIVFGSNASLDVQGSFLASTASSFKFPGGNEFSATNPQVPPLLTISVPLGLQYGNNPGSIQVQGSNLQVNPGRTLALFGGNVSIASGQLKASGGRIKLGGIAGEGTIGLSINGFDIGSSFPVSNGLLLSDVSLDNSTVVKVDAGGDGNIAINAQNLRMAGGSKLQAGASWLVSSNSYPGDIAINATGVINLTESSSIENLVFGGATGKGGDISITAGSLTVTNGARLGTNTLGIGDAGNLNIIVRDRVSFEGMGSNAESVVAKAAEGQAGQINITAHSVFVSGGATLVANTSGKGNAGNVTIRATDTVSLAGSSTGIGSQVFEQAVGNGGSIDITTGTMSLSSGATLAANTSGKGNAGNVTIRATDTVSFDGVGTGTEVTGIGSQVLTNGVGNGGNIEITAGSLAVTNGARLIASISGQGNGGNVNILVRDTVSFDGVGSNRQSSGVFSSVEVGGMGKGGDINVTTNTLSLANRAVLDAQTQTNFKAGNVVVNAAQSVNLNQASLTAQSTNKLPNAGTAGDIKINTGNLTARNGKITTSSEQSSGGGIKITASNIRLFGNSDITTNVNSGAGGGGDITMKASSILAFGDSDILAFARDGRGGNITLDTRAFFGQNYRPAPRGIDPRTLEGNNRVDVNATGTLASGTILLPDTTFIQNSLTELPENQIDTDSILASSCIVRRNQPTQGRFTITGAGGLPQRPGDVQMSSFPTVDIETLPSDSTASTTNPNRPWQKGDPIIEPQGVYRLSNGNLVMSRECR